MRDSSYTAGRLAVRTDAPERTGGRSSGDHAQPDQLVERALGGQLPHLHLVARSGAERAAAIVGDLVQESLIGYPNR
jgi:hypothetical protein